MPLSDVKCRKAKCPADKKQIKLADEKGLYLLVNSKGGKYWRMDYRHGISPATGKPTRKTLALGVYPDISLAKAREKRDDARAMIAEGQDPASHHQARSGSTFAAIAAEFIDKERDSLAAGTVQNLEGRLRIHVLPKIGHRPIDSIEAPDLLAIAREIERQGKNETAHSTVALCGRVIRYAIATGRARRDPSQDIKGALRPINVTHRPAVTEPDKIGELLRAVWGYAGTPSVIAALRVISYTFVRSGELRPAEWREIDWKAAEWRIPGNRMKMKGRGDHIVPLSSQVIDQLRELHTFTGTGRLIFPGLRTPDRPLSENTLNAALRSMGISPDEHVTHGFRATARTLLAETGWRPEIIEVQLAHSKRDKIQAAYDRASYLPERRKMMQAWADYLDNLRQTTTTM